MRPKTSCTVAMSAIATLPPMACWSASLSSSATISRRRGEPEARTFNVSPTPTPRRAANARVIAIVFVRESSAIAARRSRPGELPAPPGASWPESRPKGPSANGSSPSTSNVSSKPRRAPSSTPVSRAPGSSRPASVFTSTTGAAASTPGVRRMRA